MKISELNYPARNIPIGIKIKIHLHKNNWDNTSLFSFGWKHCRYIFFFPNLVLHVTMLP